MKRKKRKKTKKVVGSDFANSVIAEDLEPEWLSNTELIIDIESPREYWLSKCAGSLSTFVLFYILSVYILRMLSVDISTGIIVLKIFMQAFAVITIIFLFSVYKLRQINDYLIIDQNHRMIYKVAETAKQSTKSKYLAFDDIKQIGIDCLWKKKTIISFSCRHYQIIALTQSKRLIPLSEWVEETYDLKEFTENLSKFMKVEFKKPPDTEEGSKLYKKGGDLIYRYNRDFFGPYWLSNITVFSILTVFITASLYGLTFGIDYKNPNIQELAGNIVFALVMLLSSIYALVKYFVFKKLSH